MNSLVSALSMGKMEDEVKKYDLETLKGIKKFLDNEYYSSGESSLSDAKYDVLEEYLDSLNEIAEENDDEIKKKVKLPIYMGSLDKFKPENTGELERWCKKFPGPYAVSPKLDGLACLIEFSSPNIRIYTKGNRNTGYGSDISYLLSIVKNIPSSPPKNLNYVRGELIISNEIFKKYEDDFANARQLVAGIVNSKTLTSSRLEIAKEIEFIAYEIINSDGSFIDQKTQLHSLKNSGFKTPDLVVLDEISSPDILTSLLLDLKRSFGYYIDGIVVTDTSTIHSRNESGNPDFSFAFKVMLDGSIVETKVVGVVWKVSKRSLAIPRVKIIPTHIGGVTATYSSGFNAKFIRDNKIGPGSEIKIVRSGDVIPYIVEVIKPSTSGEPDMPTFQYEWGDSGVNIIATDSQDQMCMSVLTQFFKTIGVEFLGPETVRRLYENGYTTLESILNAEVSDFAKIDGMGEKSGQKIYKSVHTSLQNIKISKLLAASGTLGGGIGEKKIISLLHKIPKLFSMTLEKTALIEKICDIRGFNIKTAEIIVKNLGMAKIFLNRIKKYVTFFSPPRVKTRNNNFDGKKVVFSGIRDKELEEKIISCGGDIVTSVSKNTSFLVVKDVSESTSKIEKARELGVTIINIKDFKSLLGF